MIAATQPDRQARSQKKGVLLILTMILLLAAALRIVNILQQSFWLDEGFTYHAVTEADMLSAIAGDAHPPLFFLLMRGWIMVAGDSVLAMRYFSVLIGMLDVALIYPLAQEIARFRPRTPAAARIAVLTMLLLAMADVEIFLAQEARMYTLRTLLVELSMLAYLRWLRRGTRICATVWTLTNIALFYTHYLGALIVVVETIHTLTALRGRKRLAAFGMIGISVLAFLPWGLTVALQQLLNPSYVIGGIPSNWHVLFGLTTRYFGGQWAFMLALAVLGLIVVRSRGNRLRILWQPLDASVLLLWWLILPLAVTFVGNLWLPLLSERRISLIAPAIALLIASGLGNIRRMERMFLVGVILTYGLTTVDYYRFKIPWNRIAEDVVQYVHPGDVVLMEVWTSDYALDYYLDHWLPSSVMHRSLRQWRDEATSEVYNGELLALYAEHPTVWLVHWGSESYTIDQIESLGYQRTAAITTYHDGTDFNVYRYDRLPEEPVAAFTSGMILRSATVYPDAGRVDLLWSAPEALTTDYTVSAFVLDASGQLTAQDDSYPFHDSRPTTSWQPGEAVYDPRFLSFDTLPPGRYTVGVKVYTWDDGTVFPTIEGEEWLTLDTFTR